MPRGRSEPFASHLTPGAPAFALLGGFEAFVRGTVLSVFPLLLYRAFGDAGLVSRLYFIIGLCSLCSVLMTPLMARKMSRSTVMASGVSLYLLAAAFGMIGGSATAAAVLCNAVAAAVVLVCYNAYVLDVIDKTQLSRLEARRLLYSGLGWTVGPVLGVWLMKYWDGAPFLVTGFAAACMLVLLLRINPGPGRVIQQATRRSASPLVLMRRFVGQPRLVSGWLFTLTRSCAWWVFFVYVGIFAVERGLPEIVGGLSASLANGGLFIAPLMQRWIQRHSVRAAVRLGFLGGALCFLLAAGLSHWPWVSIAVLLAGTLALVLLDVSGGLPFLMAVKPSERVEMSAIYSSFRDVSGILTPGIAWAILRWSDIPAIFAITGVAMIATWMVAGLLHPRLGTRRGIRTA